MHYPQYHRIWSDPEEHYRCLRELWNTYDAVKLITWDSYFERNKISILDLGCGTGWLSAYLSRHDGVSTIYSVDSSAFFLSVMLPEIVKLMSGDEKKITSIRGLFTPIILSDASVDICVSSSALHHAENLEGTLSEILRVLKDGAYLFVLNETPDDDEAYVERLSREFVDMKSECEQKVYRSQAKTISSVGLLYDPILWDKTYPVWYWLESIKRAGFRTVEMIRTDLFSLKTDTAGTKLTHFICKK
jgi:ubiquinone/menaquinone biosynthesis C-methylase UbiE